LARRPNRDVWTRKYFVCVSPLPQICVRVRVRSLTVDYVLSLQATFKGWMDIMYDAIDSKGVSNAVVTFIPAYKHK